MIQGQLKKWHHKLRRLNFPRSLKHMALMHRDFQLRELPGENRGTEVVWRGRTVAHVPSTRELRDRHSGACFVICTGPSLERVDLSQLGNHCTIGVNGAIVKFQQHGMVPTYYSITDPDFFEHRFTMVRDVIRSGAKCLFSPEGLSRICQRDVSLLRDSSIYLTQVANRRYGQPTYDAVEFDEVAARDPDLLLHASVRGRSDGVGFSCDLEKGLFCGRTAGFRAVQIAYYLGFRRVFLLGMDLGGEGSQVRFYETKRSGRPSTLGFDYDDFIQPSFEVVQDLCRQSDFEVYNVSESSRLPASIVSRCSLVEAFQKIAVGEAAA